MDARAMLSRGNLNECSVLGGGVCTAGGGAATALAAGICWEDDWLVASLSSRSA
jgi:hypothetical protein